MTGDNMISTGIPSTNNPNTKTNIRIKNSIIVGLSLSDVKKFKAISPKPSQANVHANALEAEITKRAMNGELDFEDALIERVKLLKGLSSDIIVNVLKGRITLMPGAESLIKTIKRNGSYCALVSGGFTDFTEAISKMLGFDENRANTLLHENEMLSGKVQLPILGKQAKVDALIDISKKLNCAHDDVIAVGDGANDLGMLTKAGMGVALHAKPIVAAQCKARLNFSNLEGLLYLQGYSKQEIL